MAAYPDNVRKLTEAVLGSDGITTTELRRAAEARAAGLAGAAREAKALPGSWSAYVDKVALRADQVTDQDIEKLKASGHDEEEIFEVTVSAALGAGLARYGRVLDLLKEAEIAS